MGQHLLGQGFAVEVLDGDEVRTNLCRDLGFSKHDRDENVARLAYVAELLTRNGVIVLVSAISPYQAGRQAARTRIKRFAEVYVNAPLEVCEKRDVKGLYKKARTGELHGLTGIDDPYEPPIHPDVECRTDRESLGESVAKVLDHIRPYLWEASPAQ